MVQQYSNRSNDFHNQNKMDLKYRFYMFSIILQKSRKRSNLLSIVFYIFDYIVFLFTVTYNLDEYGNSESHFNLEDGVFANSFIAKFSPGIVSNNFLIVAFTVFILITIVSFVVCFVEPHYCKGFSFFLSGRLHISILPLISSVFGYDLNYLCYGDNNQYTIAYCVSFLVALCFYLPVVTLLYFSLNNSIINPDIGFSRWWCSYDSIFFPICYFEMSFTCYSRIKILFTD